jgi:hypothetical protein
LYSNVVIGNELYISKEKLSNNENINIKVSKSYIIHLVEKEKYYNE